MSISPRMHQDSVGVDRFKARSPSTLDILTEILSGEFSGLLGKTPVIAGELFASNLGGYFAFVIVGIAIVR